MRIPTESTCLCRSARLVTTQRSPVAAMTAAMVVAATTTARQHLLPVMQRLTRCGSARLRNACTPTLAANTIFFF